MIELWSDALAPSSDEAYTQEHVFVLVDHSGCDGLLNKLQQASVPPWINLFEGTREANAETVAPYLIDLGTPSLLDASALQLLRWLTNQCRLSNSLLLMRSSQSHRSLAAALKRRLDAELPDSMSVLLRYFDTRVFVALIAVLHEAERLCFLGIARTWWWMDRAGEAHHLETIEHKMDTLKAPIHFNDRQQGALIDTAIADAVAREVTQASPGLRSNLNNAELHSFINQCLPMATRHHIESFTMQILFCLAALKHGLEFHQEPRWSSALSRAQDQKRDFAWVIQQAEGSAA